MCTRGERICENSLKENGEKKTKWSSSIYHRCCVGGIRLDLEKPGLLAEEVILGGQSVAGLAIITRPKFRWTFSGRSSFRPPRSGSWVAFVSCAIFLFLFFVIHHHSDGKSESSCTYIRVPVRRRRRWAHLFELDSPLIKRTIISFRSHAKASTENSCPLAFHSDDRKIVEMS